MPERAGDLASVRQSVCAGWWLPSNLMLACSHLDVAGGTGDVAFRVLRAMQVSATTPAQMRSIHR